MKIENQGNPFLSICCITYNHEPFIRQCLDGFVMQRTNFPFEIIIHDDASTDNTAKIIKEYAVKYPDLFVAILQTKNQLSKGISPSRTHVWPRARGKYFAICEGDDYWTDPYKLQKQVDFLESNSEFGLVHTDYNIVTEHENNVEEIQSYHSNTYKFIPFGKVQNALLKNNFIASLTVVAKKSLIDEYFTRIPMKKIISYIQGDYPLWLFIAGQTKIGYLNGSTATYRVLEGSMSHSKQTKKRIVFLLSEYKIKLDFIRIYHILDFRLYWSIIKEFPFRFWAQIS